MPISTVGIIAANRQISGGGITATFQQSAVNTAGLTTYTFSAQPIGTASSTRRVVVAVTGRRTASDVSSVTIGGVSASIDTNVTGVTNDCAIVSAVVPTGTTADVVVTFSAVNDRCGIGVWTLSDGAPTGQVAEVSATEPAVLNVTTAVGDVVIAAVVWVETSGVADWTNATERYDQAVESTVIHSGADTVATGSSVSISVSTTSDNAAAAVAYA